MHTDGHGSKKRAGVLQIKIEFSPHSSVCIRVHPWLKHSTATGPQDVFGHIALDRGFFSVPKIAIFTAQIKTYMSWKIALSVALLSGLVTALVTAPVAYKLAGLNGVSEFEGKRSMYVFFYFVPLAFIGGFLLGLVGTKLQGATEWAQFWKAAGLSAGLGLGALVAIAGLSYLSAPHAPKEAGKALGLEVEVLVPMDQLTTNYREPHIIRMGLYAGDNDNRVVPVDTTNFREETGVLVVPALAPLYSHAPRRNLSFHLEETWLAFDLPLPYKPTADSTWSTPAPMRDATTAGATSVWNTIQVRYRVVTFEGAME
jgi:hypothetical protein